MKGAFCVMPPSMPQLIFRCQYVNSSSLFGPPHPNRKTCTVRFAGFTATRSIIMSRDRLNLSSIFGQRAPITMQSRGVVP